jgi:Family of unknown function (DUF6152)
MKTNAICPLVLSFAATVAPAMAHHSFDAEYDANKTATLTGIVTNVEWINPHAFITVSFKEESGATKEMKVELGPPYALTRGGWKRDTVKIGDKITMQDTALAKDGSNRAGSTQNTFLVLANGQKLPMR